MRFAALLCTLLLCAHAHAQPRPLRDFTWEAPEGCPDRERALQTIQHSLRESLEAVDATALSVRVHVQRTGQSWQLSLLLESPSGSAREQVAANTCRTLMDVVALKVAFAASQTALEQSQPPRAPLRAAFRAGAGAEVGRLPGPSAAFTLSGIARLSFVRFELGASYATPRTARYPDYPDVGADLQLVAGNVRSCVAAALGSLELLGCAGVELGVIHGSGFGVSQTSSAIRFFGEALVGPALRWPRSERWSGWLQFDGALAFARPSFEMYSYSERLFRPSVLSARALLGIELQI